MTEKPDTSNIEAVSAGTKLSRPGIVSLIIAIAVLPFFYVSNHRIHSLSENHHHDVCEVKDTFIFNTIHTLCVVLPVVSAAFAIISLERFLRKKTRFAAIIPALAGLLLALASFVIYYFALLGLANGHLHAH